MTTPRHAAREADAAAALTAALDEVATVAAVEHQPRESRDGTTADLAVNLADGTKALLAIKARAHPGPAECRVLVDKLSKRHDRSRVLPIVVADRLTREARGVLSGAGVSFLDRRGRLVLTIGNRTIEADVSPAPRHSTSMGRSALRSVSGLSAALAALLSPEEPFGVRETARAAALSHTAISQARAKLRDAHFLDGRFRPVLPELFEAVVATWDWPTAIDTTLPARSARLLEAAGAVLDGPFYEDLHALADAVKQAGEVEAGRDPHAGWSLVGTHAAAAYGADVIVGADAPTSWVVPVDRFLTATYIETASGANGEHARLLAAPCPLVVRLRRKGLDHTALAHPLVVAIELGRDPGRGREILESFEPEGVPVVWR